MAGAAKERGVTVVDDGARGSPQPKLLSMHYNKNLLKGYNEFVLWLEETLEEKMGDEKAPELDCKDLMRLEVRKERDELLRKQLGTAATKAVGEAFVSEALDKMEALDKDGVHELLFSRRSGSRRGLAEAAKAADE